MKSLKKTLRALWSDESGQSTVEYILILAVVVLVATKFRSAFTGRVDKLMDKIGGQLDDAASQ